MTAPADHEITVRALAAALQFVDIPATWKAVSLMTSFLGVPADAAYHLVVSLTRVLTPAFGGLAAAAGIVVFTAAVRLLIAPLSFRALRGQAAQARIAPQMQALRQRYARQPERLRRELTALHAREGASMLAGIWPVLAQWPFLSVMYLLFRSSSVAGGPNQLLAHTLFGVRLGAYWLGGAGVLSVQGGIFLAAFAVLAGLCWLSARLARRMTAVAGRPDNSKEQPDALKPGRAGTKVNNSKKRRDGTTVRSVRPRAAGARAARTAVAKPGTAKPGTAKPGIAKAGIAKPGMTKAGIAGTGGAKAIAAGTATAPAGAAKTRMTAAGAAPGIGAPGGATVKFLGSVLPYVTVVIAAFAPLAAGIYLITTMAWSLAERGLFLRAQPAGRLPAVCSGRPPDNPSPRSRLRECPAPTGGDEHVACTLPGSGEPPSPGLKRQGYRAARGPPARPGDPSESHEPLPLSLHTF